MRLVATDLSAHAVCSLPPCGGGLGRGVARLHAGVATSASLTTPTPNPSPQGGGEEPALLGLSAAFTAVLLAQQRHRTRPRAQSPPQPRVTIGYVEVAGDPRYEPITAYGRVVLKSRERPFAGAQVGHRGRAGARPRAEDRLRARAHQREIAGRGRARGRAGPGHPRHPFLHRRCAGGGVQAAGRRRHAVAISSSSTRRRRTTRCGAISARRNSCTRCRAWRWAWTPWCNIWCRASGAIFSSSKGRCRPTRSWSRRSRIRRRNSAPASWRASSSSPAPIRASARRTIRRCCRAINRDYDVVFVADHAFDFARQVPYHTVRARPVVGSIDLEPAGLALDLGAPRRAAGEFPLPEALRRPPHGERGLGGLDRGQDGGAGDLAHALGGVRQAAQVHPRRGQLRRQQGAGGERAALGPAAAPGDPARRRPIPWWRARRSRVSCTRPTISIRSATTSRSRRAG